MGFLDNVKDALKGAVSARASRGEESVPAARRGGVAAHDDTSDHDTSAASPIDVESVETVQAADSSIPAPAATAEDQFDTYTVETGDTLSEISARVGVSTQEIARINNIEDPDLIYPGQVFRIPQQN